MSDVEQAMWGLVQAQELPLVLTRLSDFTIQEATQAYLDQINMPADEVLGCSVFDLMDPEERPRARDALQALAEGTIDFYRTYRPLSLAVTHRSGVYLWSHAIDFGERRFALTQARAMREPTESPLVESLGYEPVTFAIGLIDLAGVVQTVSNNLSQVIGIKPDELIGRDLLPPKQRDFWINHAVHQHVGCSVSLSYTPPPPFPDAVEIQCLLVCLAGSKSFCFILSREPPQFIQESPSRTAELELRLRRIAQEVKASGVISDMGRLPDPTRFPELASLNARQWDVLIRLMGGDRVATIAHDLYLSPSAVRSYLSEIFRKFGVHSQAELLTLLRS
jgi:DNA-binding CsgD family transcriptional regulator/PAS domain-containing protein